jgi:threonine dehydrogenase-like Zn-dependent dehydrogenase
VLGHEFVGEVVTSMEEALPLGQRVAVLSLLSDGTCRLCLSGNENLCRSRTLIGAHRAGAFAEFVVVPARSCYALPSSGGAEMGALVEPLACALHAVERGGLSADHRLAVLGAGALGLLVALEARRIGARTIAMSDPLLGRRETAIRMGATAAFDASAQNVNAQLDAVTDGEGFDVVVDAFGSTSSRRQALDLVAPGGRVVLLGLHDDVLEASGANIVLNEASLAGSFAYTHRAFARATSLASEGFLDALVEECELLSLNEGPTAFADLANGRATAPRLILMP